MPVGRRAVGSSNRCIALSGCPTCITSKRKNTGKADYWNFLAAEYGLTRPVYYAGSLMRTGGHAFVLDGLDEQGFFHVNWGEGGSHDGYFRLDVLAQPVPADRRDEFVESGFFCHHEAIVCSPDPQPQVQLPDTLQLTGREIHVDSLFVAQTPLSGCHTPVTLVLVTLPTRCLPLRFI